jgi:alpha-L-fucosidase 2
MDAHPPFQIDGNFGGAAGVIEMLLQSDGESIELLPALPDAWQSGMVEGIVARGAFEISMSWKDGSLEWAEVLSKAGMPLKIHCNGKEANMNTHKGDFLRLDSNLEIVRN